ncbi:DUF2147 domain-containing protein [Limibaculum sp. M0105]|uniref:DUF2147 domain-containing protein n=1 Tax=Thermohalobaculum xanthum TaxID=2753746 RepID=A0A8J7M946_9RHOB|nr:DUF2147 domain-containing protein [Thermohalobaculum xanthum]MBK0400495.1 DUF2147 domain-containing protein [Thermohalobaculum xanthum]
MRATLLTALAGIAIAFAASAEQPVGVWKTTPKDDGRYLHIEIAPCTDGAQLLCGTTVGAFAGARTDIVGKRIFWDMAPDGAGKWTGGEIWAPDEDKTYSGMLEMNGATLEISGCVMGGLICRGQDWTRAH